MKNTKVTIKLDTGIEFEGQTIKQLAMREPRVKDMLVAQSGDSKASQAEIEVQIMANLTD